MTIPIEVYWSLERTRKLLKRLLLSNLTEIRKQAKDIREEAMSCSRHYPFNFNLREMYKKRVDERDLKYLEEPYDP